MFNLLFIHLRETPLGKVPALPTTYIIDPQGKVVAGEIGVVIRENLEIYITQKKKIVVVLTLGRC